MPTLTSSAHTIRVGCIGLSAVGWGVHILVPALLSGTNAQTYRLAAVGGRTIESAQTTAASYSKLIGYEVRGIGGPDCSEQMANDPDIDFIIVSVQTPYHKEVITPIIAAGKAFMLEWPIGGDDATEIADMVRAKNIRHMIGLHNPHIKALQKVKEIIDSGKIGKVLYTDMNLIHSREIRFWGPEVTPQREYSQDPKSGASMLNILGGHLMYQLMGMVGEFANVSSTFATKFPAYVVVSGPDDSIRSESKPNFIADHIAFSGTTTKDILANVSIRAGYPRKDTDKIFRWQIDGTEGNILIETTKVTPHVIEPDVYVNGELIDITAAYPGIELGGVGNQARLFESFADGDESGYATLDDGLRLYKVLNAIKQSADEGRRVNIDFGSK